MFFLGLLLLGCGSLVVVVVHVFLMIILRSWWCVLLLSFLVLQDLRLKRLREWPHTSSSWFLEPSYFDRDLSSSWFFTTFVSLLLILNPQVMTTKRWWWSWEKTGETRERIRRGQLLQNQCTCKEGKVFKSSTLRWWFWREKKKISSLLKMMMNSA